MHNKRLMYTVRVNQPNPLLANLILEQFGGPDGELAAAMRYFTQGLAESDPGRKDMLLDIATEELSHLEVVGNLVSMLNKGARGQMAEGEETAQLLSEITGGCDSHTTALLYGSGVPLTNSAGVPWTAAYVDSRTDPTCDLRSNIAAESRAKIIYERLMTLSKDDPDVKDALGFLMTREVAHQKSFEKALYSIKDNFPPGKLPGHPDFVDTYYNMSQGKGDMRGPWNASEHFDYVEDRDAQMAVDGGNGSASVALSDKDLKLAQALEKRLASGTDIDPTTGADLGAGPGAGNTKPVSDM
jgi:Mn-containing catalase